jgi:hypothetical protein
VTLADGARAAGSCRQRWRRQTHSPELLPGITLLCRTRFAVIAAEDALGRGASTRATELGQEGNALAQSPSAAAASASHTAPPIRLVGGPNLWFDAAGGGLSYGTGTPKSTHGTRSCSQTVPGAGVVIEIR